MMSLREALQSHGPSFLLEDTRVSAAPKAAILFCDPVHEIRVTADDDPTIAFREIDRLRRLGFYLAGYAHYELAYCCIDRLRPLATGCDDDLLVFYAFGPPHRYSTDEVDNALRDVVESPPYLHNVRTDESETDYANKLRQIHRYIFAGDTYQVNHTHRLKFDLEGTPQSLYRYLRRRQRVAYSAFLRLPDRTVVSLSPELFIAKNGNTLRCQPMKGTAPRGTDPSDDERRLNAMAKDPKQLAENLMIVDLMRNDIGRLAQTGSVRVDKLFEIQRLETVFQMTSTIRGTVERDLSFASLMSGLFPCGSITGAPKIRTMEIIRELEESSRGIYTGAIGYITPHNDLCFSVPIRTLEITQGDTQGLLGVGGGIIHDSHATQEWQECQLKAGFLTGLNHDFSLIETCHYSATTQRIEHFSAHLQRLASSSNTLGFTYQATQVIETINAHQRDMPGDQDRKIRILLSPDGQVSIHSEAIKPPTGEPLTVSISERRIQSDSIFRRHKTTHREYYNTEYADAEQAGYYDVIFLNEHHHIAEASRHNIFIERDGTLLTPPISAGALPGVMRAHIINNADLSVTEAELTLHDVKTADRVFLSNAVRGRVEVTVDFAAALAEP
ncbi:MAG TPA: aminodeoxychorismate synthase component I [Gammaproteobacteria bacterium]|jgi:para-aminobenzoate synthetase/4-amino-4-deoxychorismate lyase|nr:aminodeoxychorismate synthase component I [Gammaproteobacteria bacterium]